MSQSLKNIILEECQQYLLPRPKEANKSDFGHALIIGGDYGMAGSVRLAGEAALRSGAGLVSIATRKEHAYAMAGNCPELMCHGIEESHHLEPLLECATVVVIGPGLGQSAWGKALLESTLKVHLPMVVDADALNWLAKSTTPPKRAHWVLTPHPGEAARLLHQSVSTVQNDRIASIQSLQTRLGGVIVLKGAKTLVWDPSLSLPSICQAGNPGMATAGMGDILSGVIGGLIAQGLSLYHAACLGVIAHATAGDRMAKQYGERGLMARDLLEEIRACLNP